MSLLLTFLALLPSATPQSDLPSADLPTRPTVDSLSMIGTGCPIGGAGIATGSVNGTPVFSFPLWTMDLSSSGDDGEAGPEAEKFCVQDMQLANGPVGYQVRVAVVTVSGVAELGEGSVLGITVETSLGGEEAGSSQATLFPTDILLDGSFTSVLETSPETWSPCVPDDGLVPLIRLRTTLSLLGGEDGGDGTGSVGREGGGMEDALSVHFSAVWRECE